MRHSLPADDRPDDASVQGEQQHYRYRHRRQTHVQQVVAVAVDRTEVNSSKRVGLR